MSHRRAAARRQSSSPFGPLSAALLCLLCAAAGARAQSTEIEFPTPVRASQVEGVIRPRDVGDPRPTRYFYALTGTPGDLIITVESRNLDGAVDLFTAGTLRPLATLSLYAGANASSASRTIYLRRRESLVLRVEARSPNESEGSYRVRFEGGFEPISGETAEAPETPAPSSPNARPDQKTRRVTSVGARIEEPAPPASEPTTATAGSPAPDTAAPESNREPAAPSSSRPNAPASRNRPVGRAGRTARTTRPRPTRTPGRPATANTEKPPATTPAEPVQAEAERATETPGSTATTERRAGPATPRPAPSPRLIIETRDGVIVERFMSTVRRVTVEGGQVIVITRDGKVDRQPLANILRMSIEP